jgi:hypothetical protein
MAEKSFADYVKDVMASLPKVSNPMLSASTDETAYRANPFYMQEQIRKRIAAEEAAKAEAAKTPTVPITQGMMGRSGSSEQGLNPYVAAFLDAETPGERAQRISDNWGGLLPIGGFLFGDRSLTGKETPALIAQRALQYENIPGWLKDLAPETFGVKSPYAAAARTVAFDAYPTVNIDPIPMGRSEADARGEGGYSDGGGWIGSYGEFGHT